MSEFKIPKPHWFLKSRLKIEKKYLYEVLYLEFINLKYRLFENHDFHLNLNFYDFVSVFNSINPRPKKIKFFFCFKYRFC